MCVALIKRMLSLLSSTRLSTGRPMTAPWRTVLGFADEHLTFAQVHQRFREMTSDSMEVARLHELGDALERARIELDEDESQPDLKSEEQ